MSFLKAQVSFASNFASVFSAFNVTPLYFFSSKIIYFGQKQPIKAQIFEIFQIRQIPHVSFELTSQFLFNFRIILHCNDI